MWCFVRFCTILYNFNGSVLLSVKLRFSLCNVSKSKHFHGCFSFLYCTGCTKSHKASHMEFSLLLLSSIYGRDAISEDNIQFSRTVLTFWNQVFESENCLIYPAYTIYPTLKELSKASVRYCLFFVCSGSLLQVIIKASVTDFIFSKIPSFSIFCLKTFRRICLKCANYSLRRI